MSKKTTEHFCVNCSSDYMVTRDETAFEEEPKYCPFCSYSLEDILYYETDDFEDYGS